MGCGGSSGAATSSLRSTRPLAVGALDAATLEGQRVQVLGWVKPVGTLCRTPFSKHVGVAIVVTARSGAVRCKGSCATSFSVTDGSASIFVDASKPEEWKFTQQMLRQVHTKAMKERDNLNRESPEAMVWWATFGEAPEASADIAADIQRSREPGAEGGFSKGMDQTRFVREYMLKAGDPVAVVGVLQKGEDGSPRLVAGDGARTFTNLPDFAPAIKKLDKPPTQLKCTANIDLQEVLHMTNETCCIGGRSH